MQPGPGGLIGAEPKRVLQALSGDAVLLRSDEPDRGEPGRQRAMRTVKNRAGRDRSLLRALGAHPQTLASSPTTAAAAFRADETVRPAQLPEIFTAGGVIGEP